MEVGRGSVSEYNPVHSVQWSTKCRCPWRAAWLAGVQRDTNYTLALNDRTFSVGREGKHEGTTPLALHMVGITRQSQRCSRPDHQRFRKTLERAVDAFPHP
ncbi:hypothetical protein E2C01_046484 [Portunus trituberculatus]|uniref:Uncharacterized protein n=1 Tax=Portunus trituberculatus TaxID=210409 RepID=A0A5B7G159_PORTR|nr:hypothetical protein [Portunus trituberculatus]